MDGTFVHAVASLRLDWHEALERVEDAIGRNDLTTAIWAWSHAYAAALSGRHWPGLLAVGDAYLLLGVLGGFSQEAARKARQAYAAAMIRARNEGAIDGLLRSAEAFAGLGDAEAANRCLRLAQSVARTRGAAADLTRIRQVSQRLIDTAGDAISPASP